MKKKEGQPRPPGPTAPRPLRPVTRAAWPFGVAGFAAGAAAIGAVSSAHPVAPPCSAEAPESFADRLAEGWQRVARFATPTPVRTAGAPPPMHMTPNPDATSSVTLHVEPTTDAPVTAGVMRRVGPVDADADDGADEGRFATPPGASTTKHAPKKKSTR